MEEFAMKVFFTICAGLLLLAGATIHAADATNSDSVVKVETNAGKPDADGKQVVTLTLTIEKGNS